MANMTYTDRPASVTGVVASATPAVLVEANGQNLHATDTFFAQVHNLAALPAPGAVPTYSYRVAPGQTWAVAPPAPLGDQGRRYGTGIVVVYSTTQATYTAPAGNVGTMFIASRPVT